MKGCERSTESTRVCLEILWQLVACVFRLSADAHRQNARQKQHETTKNCPERFSITMMNQAAAG